MKSFEYIPHYAYYSIRVLSIFLHTIIAIISSKWWGISLGHGCKFIGRVHFKKIPGSSIVIGSNCTFNSSPTSNLIGVNRPNMISTLKKDAKIIIGDGCGLSGTIIASATQVTLGKHVRCGANTLINDTDWHFDDFRSGPDAPVHIGDNVWLGANVTILKGVSIGEKTVVGSGSVVYKSLPSNVIAAGIPAKIIRAINKDV